MTADRAEHRHADDPADCHLHRLFVAQGEPSRGSWHAGRCPLFTANAGSRDR